MQKPEVPRLPSSVSKAKLARYICQKKMKKWNLRGICGKTDTLARYLDEKNRHYDANTQ